MATDGARVGSLGCNLVFVCFYLGKKIANITKKVMGYLVCWTKVEESNVAIREQFGKFDAVLEPGCRCVPWFLGKSLAGQVSLRLQQLDVKCKSKTKDDVFVNVVASVQYRVLVDRASDAFYKLDDTKSLIEAHVKDVIRASVPNINLDDVFVQKIGIAKVVEDELGKAMSGYGYQIVQALIVDIDPDAHVKRAMNETDPAAKAEKKTGKLQPNGIAEAEKILIPGSSIQISIS